MSTAPASFGQEQLWLVDQAASRTSVNNTVLAWELRGSLDVSALRAALDLILARHPALRTTLHPREGRLCRRIAEPGSVPLPIVDLASEPGVAWEDLDLDEVLDRVHAPIDIGRDPVLRPVLARIAPRRHLLVITVHHGFCDGVSTGIIRADLVAAYTAFAFGIHPELAMPDGAYDEFVDRERQQWAADPAESWLRSLRSMPRQHDPLFAGRRRTLVGAAGCERVELPGSGVAAVTEAAAAAGATVTMGMLALFSLLLARWTGTTEVRFSSPVSTRFDPEFERTVGYFVNSMPMAVDLSGNPTFAEVVGRVLDPVLGAIEHAHVPPGKIQDALGVGRGEVSSPLLAVTLAVNARGATTYEMGGLSATERFLPNREIMFGLSVRGEIYPTGAEVIMEYNTDVLDRAVVVRMGQHLCELARSVTVHRRVVEFPAAPRADLTSVGSWGTGPRAAAAPGVVGTLARWAGDQPDAVAVRAADGNLCYADLWAGAGVIAARLRSLGAGAEDLVAVCLPRSAALVTAVVGVLRAGAAFVPIDPRDPVARRAALLRRSGPVAAIVDTPERAADWNGPVIMPDTDTEVDADGFVPTPEPDGLAYVIHTSGSTGEPKGVMVTHGALAGYLTWAVRTYGMGPGSTVALHTSPAFDMALTSLLGPLFGGGTVHVLPEERGPLAVADSGQNYRMIKGTPSHLAEVLERATVFPDMVVLGGENFPADRARRWLAVAPDTLLINEYGPTETTVAVTAHRVPGDINGDTVPIGTPIPGATVHVVDSDLRPVPIGVRGELVIGGTGVARGYRDAPGLTADRFVPDPFTPGGGRLYRTGDLALWTTDGRLELVGRMDAQLKILGYRVEPGEVEAMLTLAPGVAQAAVIADRREGDGVRLVGFVRPQDPLADTGELSGAVRDWLRARLPAHLVPDRVVAVDRFPIDANGKLDRRSLAVPEESPPDEVQDEPGRDTHALILAAWCEVLGVSDVPATTDFFAAGGTSLQLLQLESALRDRGVDGLTVADLFRFPTIEELAERIAATDELGVTG